MDEKRMEVRIVEPESMAESSDEIVKKLIADLDRIDPANASIEHIRWWRARGLTTKSRVLSRAELDALNRHANEILEKF